MRFGPVPVEEAAGSILGHNVAGPDGRRWLRKGKALTERDARALAEMGRRFVYVAQPDPDDVDEDRAARRIAEAVAGPHLRLTGSATGRVNLLATSMGVLRVNVSHLARLNELAGITLATMSNNAMARAGQVVATVKILPYALAESVVARGEAIAAEVVPLLGLDPFRVRKVGLILSGSPSLRSKLFQEFSPLVERIEAAGARISEKIFVTLEDENGEDELARALVRHRDADVELILLAGETAIMDPRDITPRAVERAGGTIACVGAPVDPGNLLMLAYLGDVPIVGAPGCARSRKVNVIDWILPRLLAGDRLVRADIVEMGHGGLLEDVPERPLPRSHVG